MNKSWLFVGLLFCCVVECAEPNVFRKTITAENMSDRERLLGSNSSDSSDSSDLDEADNSCLFLFESGNSCSCVCIKTCENNCWAAAVGFMEFFFIPKTVKK